MNITFIFSIKHLGHARPLTISVIVSSQMIMLFDVIKPSLGLSFSLDNNDFRFRALVSTGGVGEVAGDVGEGEVNEGPGCGFSCCFLCTFAASRFCARSLSLFTFFFTFPMLAQIRNGKKQRNFTRTKKLRMINTHTSACHSVGE